MNYKTIKVNSLVKKITKKDNLFRGFYTADPYQNCEIGCVYCDSSFEETVYVKINAVEVLEKELNTLDYGRIIIGSVHDPYQPVEKEYQLTRKILEKIKEKGFPCHILTKSDLVLRDIDIIKEMDCLVTISISSINEDVYSVFEKNAPSPFVRLETLKKISKSDVRTGIAVIPFLPFIMDGELSFIVSKASEYKADYVLLKTLELKGDLKETVFEKIQCFFPEYLKDYNSLYMDSYLAQQGYVDQVCKRFNEYCKRFKIEKEIKK